MGKPGWEGNSLKILIIGSVAAGTSAANHVDKGRGIFIKYATIF